MLYFYIMDIRQTITNFKNQDTASMDREGLVAHIEQIRDTEQTIREFLNEFNRLRSETQNLIWAMDREEQRKKDEEGQEKMAAQGFGVGSIFYIDRHEGIYVVKAVDHYHVSFSRMMDGKSWGKTIHIQHDRLDPRLTPLRTQGPFKVGETVVRYEKEFRVEGYLGYRMLLSSEIYGNKIYTIVQKKDEKTYRSIII